MRKPALYSICASATHARLTNEGMPAAAAGELKRSCATRNSRSSRSSLRGSHTVCDDASTRWRYDTLAAPLYISLQQTGWVRLLTSEAAGGL